MGPKTRKVISKEDKKETRGKLGKLKDLVITNRTLKRYRAAAEGFLKWKISAGFPSASNGKELDDAASEYLEYLWEDGESKAMASNTVAALQHFLRCKGELTHCWSLLHAWKKNEIPERAPPLSPSVTAALVEIARSELRYDLAAGIWLCFAGCLRTGELLSLKVKEIGFGPGEICTLALPHTKTTDRHAAMQSVIIRDPQVVKFVRFAVRNRCPDDLLVKGSLYGFRKWFDDAVTKLGLSEAGFRPYSLRRGGATFLYQIGRPMASILLHCRWASMSTATIYIQDAAAAQVQQQFSHKSKLSIAAKVKTLDFFCRKTLREA